MGRIPDALLLSFKWYDDYDDCRAMMEVAGLVEPEKRLAKTRARYPQAGMRRKVALPKKKVKRKRRKPETPLQTQRRTRKTCRTEALKRAARRRALDVR